jgi:Flp pilus assembly protein TadG
MTHDDRDRGAAAVELALVMMLLITIVLGSVELGRLFFIQSSLTNAARVGARTMSIEASTAGYPNPVGDATTKTVNALSGVVISPGVTGAMVSVSPTTCSTGTPVSVMITYPYEELTNFFPQGAVGFPSTLIGKASALCGG